MAKFTYVFTTVPGNSAFVVPLDSTRGLHGLVTSSIASGGANLAPGALRGRWPKSVVSYSAACTGQDVTVAQQVLTGVAGTSSDWTTVASGSATITAAAAPAPYEFTATHADFRLLVTAGATGPTTLIIHVMVHQTTDRGA